ncbi:MAG: methyltransferase domain-containing protein [Actinomycetota bacterium]
MASPVGDLTDHDARHDRIVEGVLDALAATGHDIDALEPSALSGADEFHLGGRLATMAVIESLRADPPQSIIDVGSGIGGPARTMAVELGATVVGVDLTPAFIEAATQLTDRVGLGDRVSFRVGNALDLDVDDASVDLATLFHVGMNIEDKPSLVAELARIVRPGGRVLVYDIMRLRDGDLTLPLPWTPSSEHNHLGTTAAYLDAMRSAGLLPGEPVDRRTIVADALRRAADAPPAVTLGHLMGPDFAEMFTNLRSAIAGGLVAPMEIVGTRPA